MHGGKRKHFIKATCIAVGLMTLLISSHDKVLAGNPVGISYDPDENRRTVYFPGSNGWYDVKYEDGRTLSFWFEKGYRKGYDYDDPNYRGKEIYDPASDAWYWLDNNMQGAKAVNKDVYQESKADDAGNIGKWVRYDENGHMVKGWNSKDGHDYYFDPVYGTMYKGYKVIGNEACFFDEETGILLSRENIAFATTEDGHLTHYKEGKNGWEVVGNKKFWYENGFKMGYDVDDPNYRGKEIFDPESNAWYWLDNVLGGAVATSKDVYQESQADDAGNIGKWVRYDENGHMIKGWDNKGQDFFFFDYTYGTMQKGFQSINDQSCYFDEATGRLYAIGKDDVKSVGFDKTSEGWFALYNGERMTDYTGIWNDNMNGWYIVNNGVVDFSKTMLVSFAGRPYAVSEGKLDLSYNGLLPADGCPLFINGVFCNTYNGLYTDEKTGIRWGIKDGYIDFGLNGLIFYPDGSKYYMKNGAVNEWRTSVYDDIERARNSSPKYQYEDDDTYIYIHNLQHDGCSFWVAQVFVEDPLSVGSNVANGTLGAGRQTLATMAKNQGAIFAVNGSGFNNTSSSTNDPVPLEQTVIKNGQILRYGSVMSANMMAYTYDGEFKRAREWVWAQDLIGDRVKDTFLFGPTLIDNGVLETNISDAYMGNQDYYRSVVGTVKKGYFIFLVTDGSSVGKGLTLFEARDLMKAFGCNYAYNLDGGGSAMMYFNGQYVNVNAWGEDRALAEILYVMP